MKKVLVQLWICHALDRGKRLSPFWQKQVSASPALREFARSVGAWDRLLKTPLEPGPAPVPDGLHASIMKALRQSRAGDIRAETERHASTKAAGFRWGLATAVLLLVAIGGWVVMNHQGQQMGQGGLVALSAQDQFALPAVGPVVEQLASNGVAILRFPINRQLEDLSHDLRETAQFLVASLP
jgi:hypothetical protein